MVLPLTDQRTRLAHLKHALEELSRSVSDRTRENPEDQAGASELAWAAARQEAAIACLEWGEATGDRLAAMIADAAIDEAYEAIRGRPAIDRVDAQERLAAITEAYRPIEDFGASEEHRLLRSTCRDFAQREIRPHAQAIHRGDLDVPESIIKGAAALGLFTISVPTEYSGSRGNDPDYEAMLVVTEELSRASLAAGGSLITRPEILVGALLSAGTEPQKRAWLPAIASGEKMVAVAVTEPETGSDVASIACRADRRGDGWRINGTKLWCTFAGRAELLMLLCRTGEAGHRGLSLFVAEKPAFSGHSFEFTQPGGGTLRGRAIPTIGYRGMHSFELVFEDFTLPFDALVGGRGVARSRVLPADGRLRGRPAADGGTRRGRYGRRARRFPGICGATPRLRAGDRAARTSGREARPDGRQTDGGSPAQLPGGAPAGPGFGPDGSVAGQALQLQDGRMGDPRRYADLRGHGLRRGNGCLEVLRGCPGADDLRGC